MQVWDTKTGELLSKLQGHSSFVNSIAFSPYSNRIVSAFRDQPVRLWDSKTGEQLTELQGHTSFVSSVAFSSDGNRIVSGSEDGSVRVWDVKTGELLRELEGHTNTLNSVAFSPDSNRIVSRSRESVRVWANLNLDALWTIGEDGWILSGAEKFVWVPSTIRDVLLRPHNSLILSWNGFATISFEQCRFGTSWHECYTP